MWARVECALWPWWSQPWAADVKIPLWLALPIIAFNSHNCFRRICWNTAGKCKLLCSMEITFQRQEIWMQKGLVQRSVMVIFRLNLLFNLFLLISLQWSTELIPWRPNSPTCMKMLNIRKNTFLLYTWAILPLRSSPLSLIYSQNKLNCHLTMLMCFFSYLIVLILVKLFPLLSPPSLFF